MKFPKLIQNLIDQFCKLPGIGPKTAERLAFAFLKWTQKDKQDFASAFSQINGSITHCSVCYNISEKDPCPICADPTRDKSKICVVAESHDLAAIENTGEFKGRYHVLGGVLEPLHGITPDKLKTDELVAKIQKNKISEIILAFNPDMEGEATMIYLKNLLQPFKKITITRLARGMPVGADLEYTDEITLSNALKNRKEM
ncbi:MAG: recombination protein RecR [Candidatus Buchananbacteria bacterium RBG_13_36_9]|uniref:Recombination protein RecR n=1 Tax=Candidatus Buchananbacteria bacterium RBG_13_36_9 TaxID=1797530 RepID=A0A1G1XPB6_9BACT|nr:MAG: recombination protein RecR [Candidatus Buchananbacteria bacterium RBG_13_36_9]